MKAIHFFATFSYKSDLLARDLSVPLDNEQTFKNFPAKVNIAKEELSYPDWETMKKVAWITADRV